MLLLEQYLINPILEKIVPKVIIHLATLIAGLFLMLVAGTGYAYSLFSDDLGTRLNLDHEVVSALGNINNVGFYMGLLGYVNDVVGPRTASLLGGICTFIGYFMTWCSLRGWWTTQPWQLYIYFFLIGCGSAGFYNAAMTPSVRNYPQKYRGVLIGVLASGFGISAAFFSLVYKHIFKQQFMVYILFLSIALGSIGVLASFFLTVTIEKKKVEDEEEKVIMPVTNGEEEKKPFAKAQPVISYHGDYGVETEINIQYDDEDMAEPKKKKSFKGIVRHLFCKYRTFEIGQFYYPYELFFDFDFLLVVIMAFCCVGSGLVIMVNMGTIVRSYGGKDLSEDDARSITSTIVLIISILNCISRIITGIISDLTQKYITRPMYLTICASIMAIAQFAFAFTPVNYLYFTAVVMGWAYGGMFAMLPGFVSERFGSNYFSINFSFITLFGAALGSYLLAEKLQGIFYRKFSEHGEGLVCYGQQCFKYTFFTTAGLCLIAAITGIILTIRNRRLYRTIKIIKMEKDGDFDDAYLEEDNHPL